MRKLACLQLLRSVCLNKGVHQLTFLYTRIEFPIRTFALFNFFVQNRRDIVNFVSTETLHVAYGVCHNTSTSLPRLILGQLSCIAERFKRINVEKTCSISDRRCCLNFVLTKRESEDFFLIVKMNVVNLLTLRNFGCRPVRSSKSLQQLLIFSLRYPTFNNLLHSLSLVQLQRKRLEE